jgi:DNA-binding phage protein
MLSASEVVQYEDPSERYNALRAAAPAAGIKHIARMSGVSRSQIQQFVNRRATPNASTIAKIEAALAMLGEGECR